jgi:hypothetical protein
MKIAVISVESAAKPATERALTISRRLERVQYGDYAGCNNRSSQTADHKPPKSVDRP